MAYIEKKQRFDDLEVVRTTSLTGAIEHELEHMILSGEFRPGERLNELQLSTRFRTSRGPLREALRSLQAKGYVEVVRNRGVTVRAIPVAEALEIYDLRAAVFGLAGRLLVGLATEDLIDKLNVYLNTLDQYAEQRDFDNYYPLNLAFHEFLITATGNGTLIREYKSLVNKLHLCRVKSLVQAGGLSVSNREHREMVEAVMSRDARRAQEAFFSHVENAKFRFISTLNKEE